MFRRMLKHSTLVVMALVAGAVAPAHGASCPAGYPSGPIAMEVGYAAGGGTDSVARQVAALLQEKKGWTVYVENRPGASGGVMAKGLLAGEANGLRIGVGSTTTLALNPYKSKDIGYTYESFKYLGTGMLLNYGLVALADKPYDTLDEFVAYAKKKGRATISVGALSYEIIAKKIAEHYGVNLVPIPTKGSSRALKDALGGHVDATMQGTAHVSQIRAGKMVQLATLTNNRAAYAPDTKTLKEYGVDMAFDGHIIFFLPKATDDAVHACLTEALAEVTASPAYTQLMDKLRTTASNLGPQGTVDYLAEMSVFYQKALQK